MMHACIRKFATCINFQIPTKSLSFKHALVVYNIYKKNRCPVKLASSTKAVVQGPVWQLCKGLFGRVLLLIFQLPALAPSKFTSLII